eukprot:CAMPEP_0174730228 /NCGR_PEP_ID=MMETSP1094-20130205/55183_1 /TAXON_ID=156173 /ORGANISM="Chrysochromulina brevifilum, Strain UTEX LB 985" /LENGTH=140 /DNA_ID=CAMNT_0015932453 /DNA_START=25 /DNA_END=447 /DNA_ORIENTATION=+
MEARPGEVMLPDEHRSDMGADAIEASSGGHNGLAHNVRGDGRLTGAGDDSTHGSFPETVSSSDSSPSFSLSARLARAWATFDEQTLRPVFGGPNHARHSLSHANFSPQLPAEVVGGLELQGVVESAASSDTSADRPRSEP